MCENLTAYQTNCYWQANQKTIKYLETNKKMEIGIYGMCRIQTRGPSCYNKVRKRKAQVEKHL